MAKDGTQRGGPRRGTGPKPKAVPAIAIGDLTAECELPDPYDLDGDDMPQVEDYMKDPQKDGSTLMAERIFRNTWLWLKKYGCEKLVSTQVIESYAMSYARTVQCERALSSYGFLAKHPLPATPSSRLSSDAGSSGSRCRSLVRYTGCEGQWGRMLPET
jgi:hypothetical protein